MIMDSIPSKCPKEYTDALDPTHQLTQRWIYRGLDNYSAIGYMTVEAMTEGWISDHNGSINPSPSSPNTTLPPPPPTPQLNLGIQTTLSVLIMLIIIGGLLGNIVVCLIVYQKPAMRSAINLLLANMALAHILLVLSCLPFAAVTLWVGEWVFGGFMCQILAFLHNLFISEALCVLMAISIDRYLIIVFKSDKLTPTRAKVLISVSWVVSLALSFPPVLGWGRYGHYMDWIQCILKDHENVSDAVYAVISMTFIFYGPFLILSYTYLSIIDTVRKRSNRVHPRTCLETIPGGHITQLGLSVISHHPSVLAVDLRFKTRTFKTILILFLVYVICWLPYSIAMLYWNLSSRLEMEALMGSWIIILGYMNTVVNPCVYCWRIKKFREACEDLMPWTMGLCTRLPHKTKRRIDPSGPYKIDIRSPSV